MTIELELEKMYLEDKKERTKNSLTPEKIRQNDKKRLQTLKKLLFQIDFSEIWNCHYAAYLLQHGETVDDYKLAHVFAKKAVEMGSKVTKWLFAATLDRYLVSQGKKQKFGTQFVKKKGRWEMLPIDETITDERRKEFGVPPLSKALAIFERKYK